MTDRTTTSLSMIFASRGSPSLIWIPVTLVAMGFHGPAISFGAFGLRSNMSWCGGPPTR
jgi:hypothetical protein